MRSMHSLLILFLYQITSTKSQADCKFNPIGTNETYDLSELSKMGRIHTTDRDSTDLSYYFSVCRNLTGKVCTESDAGIGCAQQWTDGACSHYLGIWDSSPARVIIANISRPNDGVVIEFTNGEKCYQDFGNHPYKAQFIFLCDKNTRFKALPAYVNSNDKCLFEFPVRTQYACAGWRPSGGGGTSSFSMGFVIILAFFGAIVVGLIIYYVILGIKSKNWGTKSMLPPLNLCRYFWAYTCVGCKVSIIWCRYKISKNRQPVGSGSLNEDNLIDTDD